MPLIPFIVRCERRTLHTLTLLDAFQHFAIIDNKCNSLGRFDDSAINRKCDFCSDGRACMRAQNATWVCERVWGHCEP